MIIDYSRRTDPACREGVELLKYNISKKGYPKLLHIWTKAPDIIALLYKDIIADLKSNNVIICAQVTINNYGQPLEKVTPSMKKIDRLVNLLGCDYIRLRFDPVIIGFTCMNHYKKTLSIAKKYDIKRITVNFLETKYQGVGDKLRKAGIEVSDANIEKKIEILNRLRLITPDQIEIAVCAESAEFYNYTDGICKASCADPEWFKNLGLDLINIKGHYSRRGCGCFYTDDWGAYPTKNGYKCPHKCLYCYAKHNL